MTQIGFHQYLGASLETLEDNWEWFRYDLLSEIEKLILPWRFHSQILQSNPESVAAVTIVDPNCFINFVNAYKNVSNLVFNITGLERSFFGRLLLNRLSLYSLPLDGQNQEINTGFICCLDYLWVLKIDQELDVETVSSIFKVCKHFGGFEFTTPMICNF